MDVAIWSEYARRHPHRANCRGTDSTVLTDRELVRLQDHASLWRRMRDRGTGGIVSESGDVGPAGRHQGAADVYVYSWRPHLVYAVRSAGVAHHLLCRGVSPATLPVDTLIGVLAANGEIRLGGAAMPPPRYVALAHRNAKSLLPDAGPVHWALFTLALGTRSGSARLGGPGPSSHSDFS
jgi:hypothetical protein